MTAFAGVMGFERRETRSGEVMEVGGGTCASYRDAVGSEVYMSALIADFDYFDGASVALCYGVCAFACSHTYRG